MDASTPDSGRPPELSVVVPVHNERDCIGPLIDEIAQVVGPVCRFELICVDDGSVDGSGEVVEGRLAVVAGLRLLRHDDRRGQSAALLTGVKAARAPWVATLDGDGQNDPADIVRLLWLRRDYGAALGMLAGHRVRRRDSLGKRVGSRLANALRRRLLRDGTPDTGCGTKLFRRDAYLALPRFDHMHRFLPALMRRDGWDVASVAVNHRERAAGRSKYNNLQRLRVGIADLLGVWWLTRRSMHPVRQPVAAAGHRGQSGVPEERAA